MCRAHALDANVVEALWDPAFGENASNAISATRDAHTRHAFSRVRKAHFPIRVTLGDRVALVVTCLPLHTPSATFALPRLK
jgi:hypothetical protein